ncbi:GNAT family N-acetyltransferase [Actinokineospora inagensis]|uniref:GNAT family N-acetyltransferase n=1 Tax=Actinokineospora inagensis TaxID=103730 RepID=UPI0003FF99D0|nr:GNAT family N-acetyltransferase [Actinokineospora inagensis]
MTIRLATDADIASVAHLRRVWTEEACGEPVDDPDHLTVFTQWWEEERLRRTFWLAETDEPIGFITMVEFVRMPRPGQRASRWGYIGNAFVVPEHRGSGVGTDLLTAALDHADTRGHVRVVLSPSERAIPLYRRAGFDTADSLMLRRLPGGPPTG